MKHLSKTIALILALALVLPLGLAACNDNGLVDGKAVITFDFNLDGTGLFEDDITKPRDISVEPGTAVKVSGASVKSSAVNPQKLGFLEWCLDKACTQPFDESVPVTKSMTLYAHWVPCHTVTYYIESSKSEETVLPGDTAPDKSSSAGAKKILGWYTSADFSGSPYNFSTPVTSDLTLYAKIAQGIFITPSILKNASINYGDANGKASGDDTTIELVGEGDDAYVKVHFARCLNSSYIYIKNFNEWMVDQANYENRFADEMAITYCNLGPATHIRFFYVVAYHQGFDENGGDKGFWYSPLPAGPSMGTAVSVNGGWRNAIDIEIKSNMEEGTWDTVYFNLFDGIEFMAYEIDPVTGAYKLDEKGNKIPLGYMKEWQGAHMLCTPRWETLKWDEQSQGLKSNFTGNDVLFKSIEFAPLGTYTNQGE